MVVCLETQDLPINFHFDFGAVKFSLSESFLPLFMHSIISRLILIIAYHSLLSKTNMRVIDIHVYSIALNDAHALLFSVILA